MKKTNMRTLSKSLSIILVASLAAACSGNVPVKEETGKLPEKAAAKKEPVEIIFYSPLAPRTVEQFMTERGNDIQAKFPNYKISFIPYAKGSETAELIAAGQSVDIIMSTTTTINELVKHGLQYDMSELIKKHNGPIYEGLFWRRNVRPACYGEHV
jgi:ABC-type glycerol-3-phosphate transport system substrate-binding protein